MHDRADTVDADLGILGFAVPKAPVQALDLLDDHRFRPDPRWGVNWQCAGSLLQVLQPHGDVEPIQDRRLGEASIGRNAPKIRTPIGEGGQHRVVGSPDNVEGAADQRSDVRASLGDGAEDLAHTGLRFDIADPHLQMSLALRATADERESKVTAIADAAVSDLIAAHAPSASPTFRAWRRKVS